MLLHRLEGNGYNITVGHSRSLTMTAFFKTNAGVIDRILRVVVGVAILSLIFVGPQSLWGLLGLVPLLTGILGICPAYSLLGISTCPSRSTRQPPAPH